MQLCRAEARRTIPASADTIWTTIRQMTGMEDWYPGLIRSSRVEETAYGPKRFCVMADGGELDERILLRDDATRTFVYAIDRHPLPGKGVVGTIRIDDLGDSAHVAWDSQFVCDPAAGQMTEIVTGMYTAGLDSLAAYHAAKS